MSWTADQTDKLKTLWLSGRSAAQIARMIGGVTRNSVIGKARRLGLPAQMRSPIVAAARAKAQTEVARHRPRLVVPQPPQLPERPLPKAEEPMPLVRRLEQLEPCQCRWPIGDPEEASFGFCGRRRAAESPYCGEHRARAYPPFRPGQPKNGDELIRALRRLLQAAA